MGHLVDPGLWQLCGCRETAMRIRDPNDLPPPMTQEQRNARGLSFGPRAQEYHAVDPDVEALREMAAWLKRDLRSVTMTNSDKQVRLTALEVPKGVIHQWDAIEPTIAEAWQQLSKQEGFPR